MAIRVCADVQGVVFKPFRSGTGTICKLLSLVLFWDRIYSKFCMGLQWGQGFEAYAGGVPPPPPPGALWVHLHPKDG